MELKEIINAIYPIPDKDLELLANHVSLLHLKKGDVFIRQHDMGGRKNSNIYLIKSGLLRSFHEIEGEEDTMWFATTGDAVASMHSFFADMPPIASVEALIDSELYCINKHDLETLFSESKELVTWGYKLAVEALYSLERRYSYIGTGDAYTRFKRFHEMRQKEVIDNIPLKLIASYLKITPQTLSRLRKKYYKDRES